MCVHQHERGPDHKGLVDDGRIVAMGHTRLALLDLSPAGDQPMREGDWLLSYNGEIYNHDWLRGPYPKRKWNGTSDTETLLHMLANVSVRAALPSLNGMFAFAVWNSLERKLYCATDPFGIKPLYIHHDASGQQAGAAGSAGSLPTADRQLPTGLFACASSAAALLPLREKWKVDPMGLARFWNLGGTTGIWQGIERIDGGMLITYDARTGQLTRERWYTPAFNPNAATEIEDLVRDAITQCATADVPVGLFYSGGIDSSVVAAVMSRQWAAAAGSTGSLPTADRRLPTGIHAFHLGTAELAYALEGAKHFGLELHQVDDRGDRVLPALEHTVAATGEPTMAAHIPYIVSRVASRYVKAAISANGADELFFGYDRTLQDVRAQHAHIFRQHELYAPPQWPRPVWTTWPLKDPRFSACAQRRWFELQTYVQHDLNPTLDAASMCHGLEMRVPYLDRRVVEAALSLPLAWHGRKDLLKRMLLATGIGQPFVDRPKLGFSMTKKSEEHTAYMAQAWRMAQKVLGLQQRRGLSGRDLAYLHAAAAGWAAWYNCWKQKMA